MICIYDTETTGLPLRGRDPLDPNQPRMVQLGCIVTDMDWHERLSLRLVVKPDGWMIPDAAANVHGISHDMAVRCGLPLKSILVPFIQMVRNCRILIAFNNQFDSQIVNTELRRMGYDDPGVTRPGLRVVDPMLIGANLMPDGKWPKLQELHMLLFSEAYEGSHDGLHDARATMRVTQELIKRKLVEL